jgi:hypothetical protein
MTVIARRIAAIPKRSSVETWERIVELVARPGSAAEAELKAVTATAAMLIAEEWTASAPIKITGGGPLVRLYTLHGTDAIEADPDDEGALAVIPTDSDGWMLSLPAGGVDLAVASKAVASCSHVEVRDVDAVAATSARAEPAPADVVSAGFNLNLEELERP